MIIYKATNLINGKIYIGQTKKTLKKRKQEHINNSKRKNFIFYKAINKYGIDNFSWEVIDNADTKEELNKKEIYWIKYYKSYVGFDDYNGYNMTTGGEGGEMSLEVIKLKTKKMKDTKRKNTNNKIINVTTQKIYNTIVEAGEDTGINPENICVCCNNKNRISAGNYIWLYLKDYENNKDYYDKLIIENHKAKKIINLTTNIVYDSLIYAEKETNTLYQDISKCCRKLRKTANNYFWAYYDDYINNLEYKDYFDKLIKNYKKQKRGILNITTGEIFDTIVDASKKYNVNPSSIGRVCKGIQQTGGGYLWRYI